MFERAAPLRRTGLAGLLLLAACGDETRSEAQTPRWETFTSARQVSGEKHLDVRAEYGAGQLRVAPASGDLLYRWELRYDARAETPVAEYDREEGTLRVGVNHRDREGTWDRDGDEARATLLLTPSIPTTLAVKFGAGKADLELGGLALDRVDVATGASETRVGWARPNRVPAREVRFAAGAAELEATGLGNARAERFEFDGGVGETTLDFSGDWTRDASAHVKMGMGSLTLRLPRELGVRITQDGFMTDFEAPGLTKRDGAYYSGNWDTAARKLTVDIDAAMGEIDVEWID